MSATAAPAGRTQGTENPFPQHVVLGVYRRYRSGWCDADAPNEGFRPHQSLDLVEIYNFASQPKLDSGCPPPRPPRVRTQGTENPFRQHVVFDVYGRYPPAWRGAGATNEGFRPHQSLDLAEIYQIFHAT